MIRTRPNLATPVWTASRKVMGNLVPALLAFPFLGAGLAIMYRQGQVFGWGLWLAIAFPLILWLAVNRFGLYQNRKMRREMQQRLRAERPKLTSRRFFVGAATPRHAGLLDPHEDVGYLILHDDKIEFFGEKIHASMQRAELESVVFAPNVHSIAGLGRWIRLKGHADGKPIRLDVELREKDTLLGNRRLGSELKKRIELWQKEKAPENPPEP